MILSAGVRQSSGEEIAMSGVNIPIGRSDFADIRRNGYYYIDKSNLIKELLRTNGIQVTLITRPRRFGKTLAMSMLSEFFDIRKDSRELFDGLAVSEDEKFCGMWRNQFPVLFLSFKSVDGLVFEKANARLKSVIAQLFQEHLYLMDSDKINVYEREVINRLAAKTASQDEVEDSLRILTKMMAAYYEKPVILLIDEYDVPLAKASENGYYKEMLDVMKGILQVFKDNIFLKYAVMTGCLRIAKESIFTGTNNFVSDTISDTRLNEYFGFTQEEVDRLLDDTGLQSFEEELREWYDGYHFGDVDVYCPWDVMNHVQRLLLSPDSAPENYWENTSDNAVIRTFLRRTDFDVNEKFEILLAGDCIKEPVEENLTYDVLESSEENLWSILYMTGYLTRVCPKDVSGQGLLPGWYALKIPNKEVMGIFKKSVKAWFTEITVERDRQELFSALWDGDAEKLTDIISNLLFESISYHDYAESFYHAFITGLFSNAGYRVESNYENGLGRSDIVVKNRKERKAVVLEAKRACCEEKMEKKCEEALAQIERNRYAEKIEYDGFRNVVKLGIAFFQKKCLVKKGG